MSYHFSFGLTLNLCLIYFKITSALATLLEPMHKKFEINHTKIKSSCQSGIKVVTHDSKSDLPLAYSHTHSGPYNFLNAACWWLPKLFLSLPSILLLVL